MLIIGLIGNNPSEKNYVVQNIIVPVLRHYAHLNIQILNISDIKKYKLEQVSQTKQIRRINESDESDESDDWIHQYRIWCEFFDHRNCNILITADIQDDRYARYIRSRSGLICTTDNTIDVPNPDFTFERTKVQDLFPPNAPIPSVAEIENQFWDFFELLFEEMHCRCD